MVENSAHGSKIMPRAPEIVPSGPKMNPQLPPSTVAIVGNAITTGDNIKVRIWPVTPQEHLTVLHRCHIVAGSWLNTHRI